MKKTDHEIEINRLKNLDKLRKSVTRVAKQRQFKALVAALTVLDLLDRQEDVQKINDEIKKLVYHLDALGVTERWILSTWNTVEESVEVCAGYRDEVRREVTNEKD